ncbi:MAG: LamG-like jellyroll fold domain-containing protein [Candidatus Thermoplasmatota archaeon]|nr:LamG-like jellyroll fold domain-containing protein [Candidatus Thermoplasmatota archaeon]
MKRNISFSSNYAVSEVIGGVILVLIALLAFIPIYAYVFPLPLPVADSNVELKTYVNDAGFITIEHIGGEALTSFRIDIWYVNGTTVESKIYSNLQSPWKFGEYKIPTTDIILSSEEDRIGVTVYGYDSEGSEQIIFDGILKGKPEEATEPSLPSEIPMLISNLMTDTIDEDLICFNYTIVPDVSALTYIYKWIVDGDSLTELFMSFDSENTTNVKDYSGNEHNGTINSATWTNDGVVGGAYYFDGSNDYISMDLPSIFNDFSSNDFTISTWIKSSSISDDWRVILEARKDNKNFVKIFQFGTEIHVGVCEDGTKYAIRTENLTSDTWYHIATSWDASEKTIELYINGIISQETGNRNYALGAHEGFTVGHASASSRFWFGYIDELQVYDHVLSREQIYQNYLCTKDGNSDKSVIVSEETSLNNVWQCIVFPNDGLRDGTPVESNTLQIVNYGGGG